MMLKDTNFRSLLTQRSRISYKLTILNFFLASVTRLNRVMETTRSAMENVGLQWNPKKCSVVHGKRGVQVHDAAGERPDA